MLGAGDREVERQGVVALGKRVQQLLADQLPGRPVVVGIGAEQAALVDAATSYREALDVAQVLGRINNLGTVASISEVRIYRPMLYIPEEVLVTAIPPALSGR